MEIGVVFSGNIYLHASPIDETAIEQGSASSRPSTLIAPLDAETADEAEERSGRVRGSGFGELLLTADHSLYVKYAPRPNRLFSCCLSEIPSLLCGRSIKRY